MLSRSVSVIFLFLVFLAYFVFGSGWYAPAQLIVEGETAGQSAGVRVHWNSGEGYNDYEAAKFLVSTFAGNDLGLHRITIRSLGEKHPQSTGKAVEITGIYLDGNAFDLSEIVPGTTLRDRKGSHLQKKGESITFEVRAEKAIRIELATGDYFGKAEVTVDGVAAVHDLYIGVPRIDILKLRYWVVAPDGQFSVTTNLPRYPIHELAIINSDQKQKVSLSSVLVRSSLGERELLLDRDAGASFSTIFFTDINAGLQRYFHPSRFLFQLLFAGLTVWGVMACFSFYRKIGGVRELFVARKRYVFWLLFASAMLCYGFWLVAFWPGIMSVDSLKIWRAAVLPGVFLHDHPVLNVIFYMYLMQIWNNVAVVPVVHIGLTALLMAYIFFYLFRQGVALFLLIPCYLLVVFSLPVGLYSIVLWKDIPFALLVVFWAFTLVRLRVEYRAGELRLSLSSIMALILLYISLGLFRYNGLIYLIVVPLFLLTFQRLTAKKMVIAAAIFAFLVVSAGLVVQNAGKIRGGGFFAATAHSYLVKFRGRSLSQETIRISKDYMKIFDMNKPWTKSDKVHSYLGDRYAYKFLKTAGWNDVYPFMQQQVPFPRLRENVLGLYYKTYEKPWDIFVWNPVFMLLLVPLCILLFRWLPSTALFSGFLLIGALSLVVLQVFNWRYYYFYFFGLHFVLPMLLLDLHKRRSNQITGGSV